MDNIANVHIKKAAVLGAGVMGAQIAAHLLNSGITPILFDLAAKEGERSTLSINAIANLKKLKPAPIDKIKLLDLMVPANFEDDLALLQDCDLIIEAISERMDWKQDLYKKISPFLQENVVFATNTSGLSINELAKTLPDKIRPRFFGIHFFNPPRYMTLVELIPHNTTDLKLMEQVEEFIVTTLGKGAVFAKDTPNFIGNRVGMFSILAVIHHGEKFKLAPDVVDLLTGPAIGRPKSATYRTLDIVGLDTFAHVVNTMTAGLPKDPWHKYYQLPDWIKGLIDKKALGQKTKGGIFKRVGTDNLVFDLLKNDYRASEEKLNPEIAEILKEKDLALRFSKLRASQLPEAQFVWAIFRDLFHYAAFHLQDIADCTRDVDFALRWGYAWSTGPFETWQAIGWQNVTSWINEEIAAGKTLLSEPLPAWVSAIGDKGAYANNGAYSPSKQAFKPRSTLSVYKKHIFPDPVFGETFDKGQVIFETDAVKLWELNHDNIAILSFKTKMNTVSHAVLDGVCESLARVERSYSGMVLWQAGSHFSLGANLQDMLDAVNGGKASAIDALIARFHQTSLALRYAKVPTVAAIRGMTLGGGCELAMHCSRIIAGFETNIGLVEVGVGLIPAGGGTKEMALRSARGVKDLNCLINTIKFYFSNIMAAEKSASAPMAKQLGYLSALDSIIMNPYELLYTAKQQVLALNALGYAAPLACKIAVAGTAGLTAIDELLADGKAKQLYTDHDCFIGTRLAKVICGGDVAFGTELADTSLLQLERECFMEVLQSEKSKERIAHTLKTGKPLKN